MDERYSRKKIMYAVEKGKWHEYIFSLCVAIGNIPGCGEVSRAIQSITQNVRGHWTLSSFEGRINAEILKKFKTELFGIIFQSTTGEANVVVRGVPERG